MPAVMLAGREACMGKVKKDGAAAVAELQSRAAAASGHDQIEARELYRNTQRAAGRRRRRGRGEEGEAEAKTCRRSAWR